MEASSASPAPSINVRYSTFQNKKTVQINRESIFPKFDKPHSAYRIKFCICAINLSSFGQSSQTKLKESHFSQTPSFVCEISGNMWIIFEIGHQLPLVLTF